MRRWLAPILAGLILAVVVHVAILVSIPRVLMSRAMQRIDQRAGDNTWIDWPRVTSASREVIRPAPELAYSLCVYDLRRGPVHMFVAPIRDYWSLALFDARTDNFELWNDTGMPHGVDIWLTGGSSAQPPRGVTLVHSPSSRGIALIRRHVTDDASWQDIQAARSLDVCAPVR